MLSVGAGEFGIGGGALRKSQLAIIHLTNIQKAERIKRTEIAIIHNNNKQTLINNKRV